MMETQHGRYRDRLIYRRPMCRILWQNLLQRVRFTYLGNYGITVKCNRKEMCCKDVCDSQPCAVVGLDISVVESAGFAAVEVVTCFCVLIHIFLLLAKKGLRQYKCRFT
jgi:hypothetical protein